MAGYDPRFRTRLDALLSSTRSAGFAPQINSGYRTEDDQRRAIDQVARRTRGRPATAYELANGIPGLAAAPGRSKHQHGMAADIQPGPAHDYMRANAARFGISFPLKNDTVHAQYDPNFKGTIETNNMYNANELGPDPEIGGGFVSSPAGGFVGSGGVGGGQSTTGGAAVAGSYDGMTPSEAEYARKFGARLAAQGTSTEPVRHWTQALARALQAGSGALWMDQANAADRKGQESIVQALSGDGDLGATGRALAATPYGRDAGIQMMIADKKAQAARARAVAEQYGKTGTVVQNPDGSYSAVQFSNIGPPKITPLGNGSVPFKGTRVVGDTVRDAVTNKVVGNIGKNLTAGERAKEIGTQAGKSLFGKPREDAVAALSTLDNIREARALIDKGMITGYGANQLLDLSRARELLGIAGKNEREVISNTQAFAANMGREVGNVIRMFGAGTGLSDADRQYAAKIAAGDITLSKDAIIKLLDISERVATAKVESYNKMYDDFTQNNPRLKLDLPSKDQPQRQSGTYKTPAQQTIEGAAGRFSPGGNKFQGFSAREVK